MAKKYFRSGEAAIEYFVRARSLVPGEEGKSPTAAAEDYLKLGCRVSKAAESHLYDTSEILLDIHNILDRHFSPAEREILLGKCMYSDRREMLSRAGWAFAQLRRQQRPGPVSDVTAWRIVGRVFDKLEMILRREGYMRTLVDVA